MCGPDFAFSPQVPKLPTHLLMCTLSIYDAPGVILGAGDTAVGKALKIPAVRELPL